MMEKEGVVRVENVSYSFGTTTVLEDINILIEEGDFMGLIGPNGSGKTTLLKLILGIYRSTSGKISLFGQPIERFHNWEKIGYIPQNASQIEQDFPANVREVVSLGLLSQKKYPRRITKADHQLIEQYLDFVGMADHANAMIGSLSGGQQQRVLVAKAVISNPRLLILDEPSTGIDYEASTTFYNILADLNKNQNVSILLVSHDIGTLTRYVTKVGCLNKRLYFHGSHDEFCSSEIVSEFLTRDKHLLKHDH